MINYFRSTGPDGDTVVAFDPTRDNPILTASSTHPNFEAIVAGLEADNPAVLDLFDVVGTAMRSFNQITERVSWDGMNVLFDGSPLHNTLADHLTRVIKSGDVEGFKAVARFWERLSANPSEHSREQAYDWLAAEKFSITEDGMLVGYKGVFDRGGSYASVAKSTVPDKPSAFVNGKPLPQRSTVSQKIGDVVTLPREEVTFNPRETCAAGLHVGTYKYARTYGDTVLEVLVDPSAIVSIPTDAGGAKMRVWKYTVSRVASEKNDSPVLSSGASTTGWADVGYISYD